MSDPFNPPMVKPFRPTSGQWGRGEGEGEGGATPSLNLNHCFSDLLLIVD